MRVLLIDDDARLFELLSTYLEQNGVTVKGARDGKQGLQMLEEGGVDAVLLDVMMPGIDGLEVCKRIRAKNNNVPVLMLTAKGDETDRVVGLEIGADDYVTKPFGIRELLARIRVRLRRHDAAGERSGVLHFGDVEVDFDKHEATRRTGRVELTGKEFEVLRLLALHRGKIVTREQLLEEVWGYESYPTTRTVDNHILRLRQKLEDTPSVPRYILSIYGEGYKFVG